MHARYENWKYGVTYYVALRTWVYLLGCIELCITHRTIRWEKAIRLHRAIPFSRQITLEPRRESTDEIKCKEITGDISLPLNYVTCVYN